MKSDYRVRAMHFLRAIYPYIENYIRDVDEIEYQVEKFNDDKNRHVKVSYGSARIALITSDYVVKWDYDDNNVQDIGGCEDEYFAYQEAKRMGYEYLLAEATPFVYQGIQFIIMPRIGNIGGINNGGDISVYLTEKEYEWVLNFDKDIHSYNWGIRKGKACIIDYAFTKEVVERGSWD